MLTVAEHISSIETEKVRVVWLGSGPWDALLSRIMAPITDRSQSLIATEARTPCSLVKLHTPINVEQRPIAASVAFDTEHNTDVTTRSLWLREDTKWRKVRREFEGSKLPLSYRRFWANSRRSAIRRLKVSIQDNERWSAAIQRLQRSPCRSSKAVMNGWKITRGQTPRMSAVMASVDFDFSFAHFLAGKSDEDPAKLQTIMIEIAAMSMRSHFRNERFGYDVALQCDCVTKGLDSCYGTLLLSVGLHRKAVQDMAKATGSNRALTRARVVVPRRLMVQTLALMEDLRSRAEVIGTIGERGY
ncbi:hypothetical protein CCUS01_09713 [Colletotrichum cuscutae]|uniref:Uncharacterized protein n=1 Tax=Colletotrichum cuscutae TaxID=1209917 RepID=A0AAI9UJE1_9PEZI|nr:hypothetical protein CCUS01_09713 [Colletotrichum cuscutae]